MSFKADPAAGLSHEQRSRFDAFLLEFEEHWSPDTLAEFAARLERFTSPLAESLLREMILIDLERQWEHGVQVKVEDYLRQYPDVAKLKDVPLDFAIAEIEARAGTGAAPDPDEFLTRFPKLETELQPFLPRRPQDTREIQRGDTSRSDLSCELPPTPPKRPKLPDRFGRYRIIRRIADGGMGAVYLAEDTSLYDRRVALKVPLFVTDSPRDVECRTRFLAEARAASKLTEHPNLCSIYEIGRVDAIDYIAMQYVDGETLETHLRLHGRLEPRRAAALVIKIAQAIDYAHQRGIIHRDLKLANIMISSLGEPVVMDFGLARLSTEPEQTRLTRDGVLIGTPAYMSPEQVKANADQIHSATDIYSLGVVFYHLLTGRLPFRGSLGTIMSGVLRDDPDPPSKTLPDLDRQLEAICLTMMSKRAEDRYVSMGEVARMLSDWLQPEQPPQVDATAARRFVHSWPRVIAVGLSLLLLIVMAVVLIVRTDHGSVRFELSQNDLGVVVDGNRFKLQELGVPQRLTPGPHRLAIEIGGTQVPLDRPFTIETVEFQGRAKLAVQIDGVSITSNTFDVARGTKHVMHVSLIDLPPPADPPQPNSVKSKANSASATAASVPPDVTADSALAFNGIDSYVSIPSFRYDGSFPMTVEAFVTPFGNVDDGHVVSNTQSSGFSLVSQRGNWNFYFRDLQGWGHAKTPHSEFGRTVHLAGVYDGREVCLFVDGHAKHRVKVQYEHRPSVQHLFLGAGNNAVNEPETFFSGLIHQVRLSSVARYNADFQPPLDLANDSSTLALYDFNEQTGDVLSDRSGNGHDGRIHHARWVRKHEPDIDAVDDWTLTHRWTAAVHHRSVRAVAVSPDETMIASGGDDGSIAIFDAATGNLKRQISVAPKRIIDLAFAPDGQSLAVCGWDNEVRVVDLDSGKQRSNFHAPTGVGKTAMTGVHFAPQGDRLISGGWNAKIHVWDTATGRTDRVLEYPDGRIHCTALSNDATLVAAGGHRTIQVWDLASGKARFNLKGHCNTVTKVAFSHDGNALLSASTDGSIRCWNTIDGSLMSVWWNQNPLVDVRWFRDHQTVVSKDQSGRVRFWNAASGQQVGETMTHLGKLGIIGLLDRDRRMVTCGDRGLVKMWEITKTQRPFVADAPRSPSGPEADQNHVLYCDGVSSHVRIPKFRYDGTHPITIETWLRLPSLTTNPSDHRPGVISQNDGRGINLLLMERGFFQCGAAGCGDVIADTVAATDRWTHVAFTYDSSTLALFVDGKLQYRKTSSEPFAAGEKDFIIAADPTTATGVSRHLRALFDEIRFSKTVRYRQDFQPPRRHRKDSETILLYHFDDRSHETAIDATGNGFDGQIHRGRVIAAGTPPPGFSRPADAVSTMNEPLKSFDTAFDSVSKETPTAVKDYDNAFRSREPEPVRWHADGQLNIKSGGGSKAWNVIGMRRGLLEVTGRAANQETSWMVNLTNVSLRRGIRIVVRSDGQIRFGQSLFQFTPQVAERLLTTVATDTIRHVNRLGLAVDRRSVQVFWNGSSISDPITLDYDLTPCTVALGNHGSGHSQFDAVRYWRPFDARNEDWRP
ncbi:Serine/threonine-protein kinase PknB [Stieleria maiorica]|uniref:Serine/threonine-protein kinase PknB n=1 Tax=Stieleria maiorica TaxID=2795974 RepID=A0A5B9MFA2_9BACT|nr:LamG-like jellyroll fold domain-containing protein [Stieleria maiorica]QEF98235.1 Serine/threonine-protein kinase PknB [Stieleria maiorica]